MSKAVIKKKHAIILGRETNLARLVALKAINPKPITVWEVLIPILFIFGYMKSKEQREIFAQNLLFTKKLALDAAFNMVKKEQSRQSAELHVKKKTEELLAILPVNIYSEAIRREQLKEMDLLMGHYCKLLQADGIVYDTLVLNAYGSRSNYDVFLERLRDAERSVAQAARRTLGTNTDTAMADRIENATNRARRAEIDRIFGTNGR